MPMKNLLFVKICQLTCMTSSGSVHGVNAAPSSGLAGAAMSGVWPQLQLNASSRVEVPGTLDASCSLATHSGCIGIPKFSKSLSAALIPASADVDARESFPLALSAFWLPLDLDL